MVIPWEVCSGAIFFPFSNAQRSMRCSKIGNLFILIYNLTCFKRLHSFMPDWPALLPSLREGLSSLIPLISQWHLNSCIKTVFNLNTDGFYLLIRSLKRNCLHWILSKSIKVNRGEHKFMSDLRFVFASLPFHFKIYTLLCDGLSQTFPPKSEGKLEFITSKS